MSNHKCGGPTEDETPCKRPVANRRFRNRCQQHWLFGRYGPIRRRWRRRRETEARLRTTAAGFRYGDPWLREVERRGCALAGEAEWVRFTSSGLDGCRFLADLAAELVAQHATTERAVREVVTRLLGDRWPPFRSVAEECAARVVRSPLAGLPDVVRALRALGVFGCVADGQPLAKCPCFRAWWDTEGRDLTKQALADALPQPTRE